VSWLKGKNPRCYVHCLGQRPGRCLGPLGGAGEQAHLLSHLIPLREGLAAREHRLIVEELNLDGGWEEEKLVISWQKLYWCVKNPSFYCLDTEERANLVRWIWRGGGIFPDFHLHLSETAVDGSCYPQS